MILVIDNYDSFTYNLVQLVLATGSPVEVRRNDVASVDELLALSPTGILLSPGPGRPEDAGVCLELLRREPDLPILGVCLGHQALGMAYGAEVGRAPELMHGKTSAVRHHGQGLFAGIPSPFAATRYHSLDVKEDTLTEALEPMAWSEGGLLMAMRHRLRPYWGVQFHPESILTEHGDRMLSNFVESCASREVA